MRLKKISQVLLGSVLPLMGWHHSAYAFDEYWVIEQMAPKKEETEVESQPSGTAVDVRKLRRDAPVGWYEMKPTEPDLEVTEDSLKPIQQEILLMKSDLALSRDDIAGLRSYLSELQQMGVLPRYQPRFEELLQSLLRNGGSLEGLTGELWQKVSPFVAPDLSENSVIGLVLPMSGAYADAGIDAYMAIKKALDNRGYKGQVILEDSQDYSNMADLWQSLQYYQPNFVIGPVLKPQQAQWQQLNLEVPTLYLGQIEGELRSNERSLSVGNRAGVYALTHLLEAEAQGATLLLYDEASSETAFELQKLVDQNPTIPRLYLQPVTKDIDQAVAEAFGVAHSNERYNWLRSKLGISLQYQQRPRRDVSHVISLLQPWQSVQVSPLFPYFGVPKVQHIWFPLQKSYLDPAQFNPVAWQNTQIMMPKYWRSELSLGDVEQQTPPVGIFTALGEAVVALLFNAAPEANSAASIEQPGARSKILLNEQNQAFLAPIFYWLDKGRLEALTHSEKVAEESELGALEQLSATQQD